jgi:hypothetical protein
MLKNSTELLTEALLEKLQKKEQCGVPAGLIKEKSCNKDYRLTGLSNSGG